MNKIKNWIARAFPVLLVVVIVFSISVNVVGATPLYTEIIDLSKCIEEKSYVDDRIYLTYDLPLDPIGDFQGYKRNTTQSYIHSVMEGTDWFISKDWLHSLGLTEQDDRFKIDVYLFGLDDQNIRIVNIADIKPGSVIEFEAEFEFYFDFYDFGTDDDAYPVTVNPYATVVWLDSDGVARAETIINSPLICYDGNGISFDWNPTELLTVPEDMSSFYITFSTGLMDCGREVELYFQYNHVRLSADLSVYEEQSESLKSVEQAIKELEDKQEQTNDKLDQIIDGTVAPETPSGGDAVDDYGDLENEIMDDMSSNFSDADGYLTSAIEIITKYGIALLAVSHLFGIFWRFPFFAELVMVAFAFGMFGTLLGVGFGAISAHNARVERANRQKGKGG